MPLQKAHVSTVAPQEHCCFGASPRRRILGLTAVSPTLTICGCSSSISASNVDPVWPEPATYTTRSGRVAAIVEATREPRAAVVTGIMIAPPAAPPA